MQITPVHLADLAARLMAERKRQGLSRSQAAAVCDVSASFIRDAECTPERCSLGKLLQLVQGLGLSLQIHGWPGEAPMQGVPAARLDAPATSPGLAPGDASR